MTKVSINHLLPEHIRKLVHNFETCVQEVKCRGILCAMKYFCLQINWAKGRDGAKDFLG